MNASHVRVRRMDWQPALTLGTASAVTVACVLPYALGILSPEKQSALPPLTVLVPLQVAQGFVLFTLFAWIGLRLGPRNGLDAPLLRNWLRGERVTAGRAWWSAALVGALLSVISVAMVVAMLDPHLPAPIDGIPPSLTPLEGFLASFYGGIGEEVLARLFIMSLVAWAVARAGGTRRSAIAIGVLVAALAFGALHLPTAAEIWPLDGVVVARTLAANALPGVVFGVLYARHGLECAMAAHFTCDLGLHVVAPLLFG